MTTKNSSAAPPTGSAAQDVRPRPGPDAGRVRRGVDRWSTPAPDAPPGRTLDATDRAILRALVADGRMPNNALAEIVGIAPSTCLTRLRALRESGVIRGFHAEVDPAAVGLPLQAIIAVRLQATARDQLRAFTDRLRAHPAVQSIFFLAGTDDFLIHVVAPDPTALREFVLDELSAHHEVALTDTKLIFDHIRGGSPVG